MIFQGLLFAVMKIGLIKELKSFVGLTQQFLLKALLFCFRTQRGFA
jgi:hypothetical protein